MTLSFSVFLVLPISGLLLWELVLAFLFPVFFSFTLSVSDVLMSGIWNEVAVLEDPSLRSLVPDLLDLQMESRASSVVTKYKSGWLRWRA